MPKVELSIRKKGDTYIALAIPDETTEVSVSGNDVYTTAGHMEFELDKETVEELSQILKKILNELASKLEERFPDIRKE